MKALIVGGGIGGLAAATSLQQAGLDVVVLEQASELGEVGAGLVLWGNTMKILRKFGVADDLMKASGSIRRSQLRSSKGVVLSEVPVAEVAARLGEANICLRRTDLHQALLSDLPKEAIRLNSRCTGFEQN